MTERLSVRHGAGHGTKEFCRNKRVSIATGVGGFMLQHLVLVLRQGKNWDAVGGCVVT